MNTNPTFTTPERRPGGWQLAQENVQLKAENERLHARIAELERRASEPQPWQAPIGACTK